MESLNELRKAKAMLDIAFQGDKKPANRLKNLVYALCFALAINVNWHSEATFQAANSALPLKPKHVIGHVTRNKKTK